MWCMTTENLEHEAKTTWHKIAAVSPEDRVGLFWGWCRQVVSAHEASDVSAKEAAGLLIWPKTLEGAEGLSDNANALIVLEAADAIVEGDAYVGVPHGEDDAWAELKELVYRYSANWR